jgi:hypothetical protein
MVIRYGKIQTLRAMVNKRKLNIRGSDNGKSILGSTVVKAQYVLEQQRLKEKKKKKEKNSVKSMA